MRNDYIVHGSLKKSGLLGFPVFANKRERTVTISAQFYPSII